MITRLLKACIFMVAFFCGPILRAQVCFDAPTTACTGVDVYFFSDCIQEKFNKFNWYVDGALEYQQEFPVTNPPRPNVPSFTYRFTTAGSHTVKLGAVCSNVPGCSITSVVYAEQIVNVTGVPAMTTLANFGANKFCDVGSVSLAVVNPTAGVTYTWRSSPAGFTATGTSVSISNITASTQYHAKPNAGGCTAPEGSYSVTVYRTIGTPLILSASYRKTVLAGTGRATQYWQRSSTGADKSRKADVNWTVDEGGSYYIRNYESSIDCWSVATGPAVVSIDYRPTLASVLQVQKEGYNNIIITNDDKAQLLMYATYYWVKDASAEPAVERPYNSGATLVGGYVDRSGTYYLKGKDNDTGTWGPTLVVQASVRSAEPGLNSIQTTVYDGTWGEIGSGEVLHVAGESKAYFRTDGRTLQVQTRNLAAGRILVSQPLYDAADRAVAQTLAAPIKAGTSFMYNGLFARSVDGCAYGYRDFDNNPILPVEGGMYNPRRMAVGEEGTLGWYYSGQNTLEKNVPRTGFPYSRVIEGAEVYKIRTTSGPGDQHHLGTGRQVDEYKLPVVGLLDDYLVRRRAVGLPDNKSTNTLKDEAILTKVKDENGKFAYSCADKFGRVLMVARGSGTDSQNILDYQDVSYNFYDDSGRLVSAVSPNGVLEWSTDQNPTVKYPTIDKTTYVYDFQGRLLEMTEPDAGITRFVYRKDGQIRFSQNAVQRAKGYFSYTHYDLLSRPVESGEYMDVAGSLDFVAMNDPAFRGSPMEGQLEKLSHEITWPAASKKSWVRTAYDLPDVNFRSTTALPEAEYTQRYVRGAVSRSENQNMMTWYSYDEFGRVVWMAQKPTKLRMVFVVRYRYDFLGHVEQVANLTYNMFGALQEQFYHHYAYDADKRLSKAYTSTTESGEKFLRASYEYYLHGPLKRIELGNRTQGVDFVYNIQGWLRQINHPDPLQDPGGDTNDAFGMVLDYYESDMNNLFPTAGVVDPYRSQPVPESLRATTMTHEPLLRFLPEPHVGVGTGVPTLEHYSADNPVYRQMLQHPTLHHTNR